MTKHFNAEAEVARLNGKQDLEKKKEKRNEKQDLTICCLEETHIRFKDTNKLKG